MFKHLLHRLPTTHQISQHERKDRLPRIWKVAGKTINFS